jgi:2-oxo-4-hydroxy-4-carboxy-5-ureidoimidazoline decarboxylase
MTLTELNALAPTDAADAFWRCCSSVRWAGMMAALRPFRNEAELFQAAESAWWELSSPDWLEAFSHHPRIGERSKDAWASQEQAGARDASAKIKDELAKWNIEYERRFGFVFLICATGKPAGEMLAQMEQRMNHEPAAELKVAAGEQAKITRLRLEKLLA